MRNESLLSQEYTKVNSLLLGFTKNHSMNQFAFADRAFSFAQSEDLNPEWFVYRGGLIKDSRCFCKERNGGYFHRFEVESWGSGADLGACGTGDLWQGAIKGTNSSNIWIVLGGYNCLHSIMPVSSFRVPEADKERARSKGFYNF